MKEKPMLRRQPVHGVLTCPGCGAKYPFWIEIKSLNIVIHAILPGGEKGPEQKTTIPITGMPELNPRRVA